MPWPLWILRSATHTQYLPPHILAHLIYPRCGWFLYQIRWMVKFQKPTWSSPRRLHCCRQLECQAVCWYIPGLRLQCLLLWRLHSQVHFRKNQEVFPFNLQATPRLSVCNNQSQIWCCHTRNVTRWWFWITAQDESSIDAPLTLQSSITSTPFMPNKKHTEKTSELSN